MAAGFRNEFKGIIRVNVDEWLGHHGEKHFLDFLQYLQINTSSWLVVLTLSNHQESAQTQEMEAVVSMYLRLEKVTLHMPSDADLAEYAAQHLGRYGLILTADARDILTASIGVLRDNAYFYGLHTISDLCNDIVYSLFSESSTVDNVISGDMLEDFSADSDYIKRTVLKIKRNALGF